MNFSECNHNNEGQGEGQGEGLGEGEDPEIILDYEDNEPIHNKQKDAAVLVQKYTEPPPGYRNKQDARVVPSSHHSGAKDFKMYQPKNINICNNCNKQGHLFHQCKLPVISFGIIAFRHSDAGLKFLMIRRKDSFGYIDFIRGKYPSNNIEQLRNIINEMSVFEKNQLLTQPFPVLCKELWGETNVQYRSEEINSQKKFEMLKAGITIDNETHTLRSLIQNSPTRWEETEWEFPKGRKNYQETDLDCALREFTEETGYSSNIIHIVENVMPYEEIFIGSNYKSYKHKYYLAHMPSEHFSPETTHYSDSSQPDHMQNYQKTEVSKIAWKTYEECMQIIRPYNLEKKQLITNINKVLTDYILY